jgi:glycosyltransferase involved in cell wall biosynthesis
MSRHGERMLKDADLAPLYVPHAIDTAVFRPGDRAAAREAWNLPSEAFVLLMVATNADQGPSRKGWVEALRAFKAFHDLHQDAILFVHTDLTGEHGGGGAGVNIGWLCDRIGIKPEWLKVTPPRLYEKGLPAEALAELYNAADVLLAPSYGEGFGIPVVEAQACGTPVIVSDWTAQPELCGAGWVVPGEPEWIDRYRAWWQRPSVDAIVAALDEAHALAGDQALRDAATRFAAEYDADRVYMEHWRPALDVLTHTAAAVPMNRAARRRAARETAAA